MSWDGPVVSAVEDKSEVNLVLEEPIINLDVLLNNSNGFLFPLPSGQSIETLPLTKKGKPGRKANFTPEEDAQLEQLVKTHGETKWSFIASIMKKWNRKQLRERYINFIKGKSTAASFTPTEDAIVIDHIKNHGHMWKDLAAKLPGRSPIAIKNRYYKIFLKKSPSLSASYKDMKNDTVSGRISTKSSSVNEKLGDEPINLESKVKILIQQEERFIEGIKKIEAKLCALKTGIKETTNGLNNCVKVEKASKS